MWRPATPLDDADLTAMCLALNREDPGPAPVPPEHMQRTLQTLRAEPWRGRALVLDLEGHLCGYALVISFWSNELGGEAPTLDEIYVKPDHRGRGHATDLIEVLSSDPSTAVALTLEVTANNTAARRLYERLGFRGTNLSLRRPLTPRRPSP